MKSVIRGCFFSLLLASSVGVNAESVAISDSSQVTHDSVGVKVVQGDSLNRLSKRRHPKRILSLFHTVLFGTISTMILVKTLRQLQVCFI